MPRGANDVPDTKMIGWYDPLQLMRTAGEVIISTLFARHVDDRRIQGLVKQKEPFIDLRTRENFRDADGSIGIDFVADTGDGWNSSYAVARAVADDDLAALVDDAGTQIRLPRGMLLVLGGDLIYPTPSAELYAERLLRPFHDALASPPPRSPYVLAIPGNHDWYDSLVAFRRLFCAGEPFGAWRTLQQRSYFAARLSERWWLLGVDVQLDHDIDDVQFKYFDDLAGQSMAPEARVIICCAEPYWLRRHQRQAMARVGTRTLLERLIGDSLRQRVRIIVAGDLHHYRRHSSSDNLHFVTCGTGGAFLHPTHELPAEAAAGLRMDQCYPTASESRKLTFRNLGFIWINPKFGIVPAIAYLLVAWATGLNIGESFASGVQLAEIGRLGLSQTLDAVIVAIHSALLSPIGAGLYIFITLGFIFFADAGSNLFRVIGGLLHTLAHIVVGFSVFWLATYLSISVLGLLPKSILQYLVAGTIMAPVGWVAGSVVLGLYLLISLNVFGRHSNEAFSALRIQDWKGFLRCRIDAAERLTVSFVGFRRVPRRWRRSSGTGPFASWEPNDRRAAAARLVDQFTVEP